MRQLRSTLGWSRYALSGETAEAIGILEREAKRDPAAFFVRQAAAAAYLDVDDPAAAESAGKGMPLAALLIAQYRRERTLSHLSLPMHSRAGKALGQAWFDAVANALRDEALATGQYATALAAFEKARSANPKGGLSTVSMNLVYAHTLILSGDTERGHALAKSLLHLFEVEQVGRPPNWFARNRAMAYALLGDDERALAELAASVKDGNLTLLVVHRRAGSAVCASAQRPALPGAGGNRQATSRAAARVARRDEAQGRGAEAALTRR